MLSASTSDSQPSPQTARKRLRLNAFHVGTVRQWHWVSSAVCLGGLLLFAVTGITLNHASIFEGQIETTTIEQSLPEEVSAALRTYLAAQSAEDAESQPLPASIARFIYASSGERLRSQQLAEAQFGATELYVSLPRVGGDAWLVLDADMQEILYERTDRGAIAYLNDLHKGRNTGKAWSLLMDAIALSCVVFALTGLWLLIRQQRQRPLTWALTTLGLVLPIVIMLIHLG